jgi:hypothetical protein
VSGAAEGSFETRGPTLAGQSAISAVLGPKPIVSGLLDAISFPSRGVVTARVTSIGTTPLPDDAEVIVAFTPRGQGDTVRPSVGQIGLRPGESGTFAFEPTLQCVADGPTGCALYGAISATLDSGSPNRMADGVVLRVDWTLELGVGLGRAGSFEISVDPSPSATARP